MNSLKIAIGADHAGFELKEKLAKHLQDWGHEVIDHGTNNSERVDYPDFGHLVAKDLKEQRVDLGLVICGSGNGINMAVNKYEGIRSAISWTAEIARLARQHNDANVLALPARFISEDEAEAILKAFLEADFEGGRHARRVAKINPKA